jgi:protein-S-isoprenylcysteine O-methyltransferase Ste14
MKIKLAVLYILDQILGVLGMAVALFWSAGRFGWWPAWAAIAVWLVCFTAMDIIVFRLKPDLVAERISPPKGAKAWDRAILSVLRLAQLARYILAGLDQRYGWTSSFPRAAQITAIMICLLGYGLLLWAMASNSYFSQVVRIQSDRGHAVAANGPYRHIRHPAYIGMILFDLAISALLASWWAIIAGGLCAILLIVRTALEDRTLQKELSGYAQYADRVHYRLLPGIW